MIRHLVVITFALIFMISGCSRKLSDRDIFHQAAIAAKSAKPEMRWYVYGEIAKSEAEHGYYGDALHGWDLSDRFPDQLYADIVAIRARTGDLEGAKALASRAADENARQVSLYAIALVQAESGDSISARESIRSQLPLYQQKVLQVIATQQALSGDVKSALGTAGEIGIASRDGVLFEIASQLAARGDKVHAQEIALHMTDRRWANNVGESSSDPCDRALLQADPSNLERIIKQLNSTKCNCKTLAFVYERAGDLPGAERAMKMCSDPADVSAGMAELATRCATNRNIDAALKFADAVHVSGAESEERHYVTVLRAIGKGWAVKDRTAALRWAEVRPEGEQRAMALLGVAEAMKQ